jgi:putative transposase
MSQNTVFHQVVKLIPRTVFQAWVHEHGVDHNVRTMDYWTWFGALLFGQLTGHDSIRAIERIFAGTENQMHKLGFRQVKRSTLADANKVRSLAVLDDAFKYVLSLAQTFAPGKTGFRFKGNILALDSTTIELCLSLCPWARFHHDKGAIKLHTAIDIAGDLPQFAVMTDGRVHDVTAAKREIVFPAGTTVAMDRAYIDYAYLNSLNKHDVFFVTRMKSNCQFKVLECRETNRTRGHMCDQTIRLKSAKGQLYEGKLRRVSYREPDTKKWLVFLTNRFDLATQTICDLYKARWKVELFFKTLKQNLRVKKFLGTSVNAVKAQIYVALIAYLLVQVIRFSLKSNISIPDTMAILGALLLLKEPIKRLLGVLPRTTRYPPGSQIMLPF